MQRNIQPDLEHDMLTFNNRRREQDRLEATKEYDNSIRFYGITGTIANLMLMIPPTYEHFDGKLSTIATSALFLGISTIAATELGASLGHLIYKKAMPHEYGLIHEEKP